MRAKEQEDWRRIVVKVICWSDGLRTSGTVKKTDTISPDEWHEYCKRTFKINVMHDKKQVQQDLDVTQKLIQSFGGFKN